MVTGIKAFRVSRHLIKLLPLKFQLVVNYVMELIERQRQEQEHLLRALSHGLCAVLLRDLLLIFLRTDK